MLPDHVPSLPLVSNICDQMLREVARTEKWSMAHVVMNPGAFSLLHKHEKMKEVYIITKGSGILAVGREAWDVKAGNLVVINAGTPHRFFNTGVTSLEHFVLASPPFDPTDVHLLKENGPPYLESPIPFPEVVECFDGAKIIAYELKDINLSFAFGSVINDPKRRKKPHFHKHTTEWVYVVEGAGFVKVEDEKGQNYQTVHLKAGDWLRIDPGWSHAFFNKADQHLVVLCMCDPKFEMDDVHYRKEI